MTRRTEDNSVMVALRELRELEADRLRAEERRRAEEAQAKARAERAAREREEHARRVAEEEARLRVERDLRARDAEAERRMAALRAELEAVRADRARIQAAVSRLNDDLDPPRTGRGWAFAFASAALVAAGLGAALLMRPPVVHERIVRVPVETPAARPLAETDPKPAPAPADEPSLSPDASETDPEPPIARAGLRGGQGGPAGGTPQRTATGSSIGGGAPTDPALDFDHCGDDPTCGLDMDL